MKTAGTRGIAGSQKRKRSGASMETGGLANVPLVDLCGDSPANEDSRPPKRVRRMFTAAVRFPPCYCPVSCPRPRFLGLRLVRSKTLGTYQSGFAGAPLAGSNIPSGQCVQRAQVARSAVLLCCMRIL